MEPGEKCIAKEGTWYNAFGDKTEMVSVGMRLTVKDSIYVGGSRFYAFDETIKGNYFIHSGFTPLRNLN